MLTPTAQCWPHVSCSVCLPSAGGSKGREEENALASRKKVKTHYQMLAYFKIALFKKKFLQNTDLRPQEERAGLFCFCQSEIPHRHSDFP